MKRVIAVALSGVSLVAASGVAIPTDNRLSTPLDRAADQAANGPLDRAVDQAANGFMVNRCHVGLSIVVHARGHDDFYNYGTASRDRAELPRDDSVYELASVTKTFIGALAAKALTEHKMLLDGDFQPYLPGAYSNLEADGRPITLRTLATHSSGLQRDLPDSDAVMRKLDYDHVGHELAALDAGFTEVKSLQALHGVTLRSTPGARFMYSNIGIRVIGYGLEKTYHTSLSHLLAQNILDPLGMAETSFEQTRAMRAREVTPYSRFGHVQPYHDLNAGAAYGLYSTPRDMARYLVWQLDEHDAVVARAHALIRGAAEDGQGLIWNIGRDGNQRILWHGGGSFGETSQMVIYPDEGEGFVLLANDACAGTEGALKEIAMDVHHAAH